MKDEAKHTSKPHGKHTYKSMTHTDERFAQMTDSVTHLLGLPWIHLWASGSSQKF